MTTSPYPTLFSPFRLGHVEARNPIVSTSHGTNPAEGEVPSDRLIAYHAAKAEGGRGTGMRKRVRITVPTAPIVVTPDGVRLRHVLTDEEHDVAALHLIGDAVAPKHLRHAMVDGARTGRGI